jgi:hypothetical protein
MNFKATPSILEMFNEKNVENGSFLTDVQTLSIANIYLNRTNTMTVLNVDGFSNSRV